MELTEAISKVKDFKGDWLGDRLATIERECAGCTITTMAPLYPKYRIETTLLEAAIIVKDAARQIDEVIHATGILKFLPNILQADEIIESLSLGAGSTGKRFDLVTNLRIAEFTFTNWKGGSETIRQNRLFQAFYNLAEYATQKKRYLYVLDSSIPLKFLDSGRSIESALSNPRLRNDFQKKYGTRFVLVREYYNHRKDTVEIVDLFELTRKGSET